MSRAYRIKVKESLKRVVTAKDGVSTRLEILEILPPEEMAGLLAAELEQRGFERRGDVLVRKQAKGITVTVDPRTGEVAVQAETSQKVEVETERSGTSWDEAGPHAQQVRKDLQEHARKELEKQVEQEASRLQGQITDRLEAELAGLRQELDTAVNKVTGEALKRKAAQMGQIKELTEDPQSGSLTIVVEV